MNPSIKRRLAVASCRGSKQISLVNELLEGPITKSEYRWGYGPQSVTLVYGHTMLSGESFRNLKRRLTEVGFSFKETHGQIEMFMPEEH